jgi:hypothetical protein
MTFIISILQLEIHLASQVCVTPEKDWRIYINHHSLTHSYHYLLLHCATSSLKNSCIISIDNVLTKWHILIECIRHVKLLALINYKQMSTIKIVISLFSHNNLGGVSDKRIQHYAIIALKNNLYNTHMKFVYRRGNTLMFAYTVTWRRMRHQIMIFPEVPMRLTRRTVRPAPADENASQHGLAVNRAKPQ